MAILTSLEDIVQAIVGSVMNAQHMVEKAQVANIASFFNDDHQPTVINLDLPANHSTADPGTRQQYSLPLISLVAHSSLIIGEAEIDLDVELGAFEQLDQTGVHTSFLRQTGRAAPSVKKPTLMVNAGNGGIAGKNGNAAHIKLKLLASEKSEGLARLLNDVVLTQGLTGVLSPAFGERLPDEANGNLADAGGDPGAQ